MNVRAPIVRPALAVLTLVGLTALFPATARAESCADTYAACSIFASGWALTHPEYGRRLELECFGDYLDCLTDRMLS